MLTIGYLFFQVVCGGFISDLLLNYDPREKPEKLEVIKCIPQIYWLYEIEANESKFRNDQEQKSLKEEFVQVETLKIS